MSRVSRVPYHQNVYDLLQIEPDECPEAARMIAEHEAAHGPLPASVREWYLVPGVVPLGREGYHHTMGWYGRGDNLPRSLTWVLDHFARRVAEAPWPNVCIMDGHQMECRYFLRLDRSDDPPVYNDHGRDALVDWKCAGEAFSAFVMACIVEPVEWALRWPQHAPTEDRNAPHANGLWLRSPDEPFQPPVIDFLIDHFGEPHVTPRPGNVSTYTWRPPGGTVRVTADEPTLSGGLSAWWVHADTPERLAEFARLLLPWGTLRATLRADTEPARDVLNRARGG